MLHVACTVSVLEPGQRGCGSSLLGPPCTVTIKRLAPEATVSPCHSVKSTPVGMCIVLVGAGRHVDFCTSSVHMRLQQCLKRPLLHKCKPTCINTGDHGKLGCFSEQGNSSEGCCGRVLRGCMVL